MSLTLAWKDEDYGPDAPHIVVRHTRGRWAGTYGVWVALDGEGHARPVGSGRGLTSLPEAIRSAREYNARMHTGRDD